MSNPTTDYKRGVSTADEDVADANTHEADHLPEIWETQTEDYKRGYSERWEELAPQRAEYEAEAARWRAENATKRERMRHLDELIAQAGFDARASWDTAGPGTILIKFHEQDFDRLADLLAALSAKSEDTP